MLRGLFKQAAEAVAEAAEAAADKKFKTNKNFKPNGIYKISRESWVRETSQQWNATV
jgi:hypothetical protein